MISRLKLSLILTFFFPLCHMINGQNRSLLGTLGGGEGVTQSWNYGNANPAPPQYDLTHWYQAHGWYGGFNIVNSNARSGNSAYNANGGSTAGQENGPLIPISGGSTKKWVLQFYAKIMNGTGGGVYMNFGYNRTPNVDGSSGSSITYDMAGGPSGAYSYTKVVVTNSTISNANYVALVAISTRSGGYNGTNLDDIAIYETDDGLVDNTAPGAPTNLSVLGRTCPDSTVDLSWSAPATGLDGGGYLVVRYTNSPAADDLPNVNGIYAAGNTITFSNTGLVVYQGTNTSFTDLTSNRNKTYYYRVFTFDKAYNYSNTIQGSVTTPPKRCGNISLLGVMGGAEGVTQSFNYGNNTPVPPSYDITKWWQGHSNYGGFAVTNSGARSGNSAYTAAGGSTAGHVHGPIIPIDGGSAKKWVLQFYGKYNGGGVNGNSTVYLGYQRAADNVGNGESPSYGFSPSRSSTSYQKYTLTNISTSSASYIALNATSISGWDYASSNIDDIAIYETDDGLVDDSAPSAPTNLIAQGHICPDSTMDISWSAPTAGVDGGGYMLVRYTSSPTSDDLPNVNGVYAVGSTITKTNTGLIIYQGSNTSFRDLTCKRNTPYYYRLFTYDKAYNYSSLIESSATTGTNGNTTLTITPNSPTILNGNGIYEAYDIASLTASGGSSYIWSGGSATNLASNTFKSSGTYTISMTASGCTYQSSIQVLVKVIGLDKYGNVTEDQTIQVTPYGDINKKYAVDKAGLIHNGSTNPDGKSANNASTSAYQIKQDFPSSTDGVYWIKNININSGNAFQIYADMTTSGGGWMLLNSSGGRATSSEITSITSLSTLGYLPRTTVITLANISNSVLLKSGPSQTSGFTNVAVSTDSRPITALKSNNTSNNGAASWHNGVYSSFSPLIGSWTWTDASGVANGWPNMFHSSGNAGGVHWLPSYSQAAGINWDSGYYYSTWIK